MTDLEAVTMKALKRDVDEQLKELHYAYKISSLTMNDEMKSELIRFAKERNTFWQEPFEQMDIADVLKYQLERTYGKDAVKFLGGFIL